MKSLRIVAIVLILACLCPILGGCQRRDKDLKMGLGIVASQKEGKASFSVTVCAVVVDRKGEIRQIALDVIDCSATVGSNGSVSAPKSYESKQQKGYFYGMQGYSGIDKEWNEQAEGFCYFAKGKTAEKLTGLVDDKGQATDSALKSICTIGIGDFVKAAVRAINNADVAVDAESTVSLGLYAVDHGSASASDTAAGKYAVDLNVAAVAAKDGIIDSLVTDVLQMSASVSATGAVSAAGALKTKDELGDEYGMKSAWGSQREWYEHNDAFCAYAKGKNASALLGLPDASGKPTDADLLTTCTIGVSELCRAVVMALNAQN